MSDRTEAVSLLQEMLDRIDYAEPISLDGMTIHIGDDLIDEHGRFNENVSHYWAGWSDSE